MNGQRLFVALFAGSVAVAMPAAIAVAQGGGNVELGGFGQYTHADDAWHVNSGWGAGGRLGVFLNRRWELEGDASFSNFTNQVPPRTAGSSSEETFNGQLDFNIPFGMGGRTHQLLLEAGAGGQRFNGHNDFSAPLGGGVRFNLSDVLALRFDGIVEYVENPTAATFGFPPVIGVNQTAARSTNVELRAGLSFLLGNHHAAPAPAPAPTPAPPPRREEPAPRREAPPPPAPRGPNTDSIAAANRARAALEAKVYFAFDKSDLAADQRQVLDDKLPILRANTDIRIRIEGNADERGSDEYNQALAMRRAQTARKYLIDRGIDAARIDIASNGEEKPVCTEHQESCWSQNRRDEFVIVAGVVR